VADVPDGDLARRLRTALDQEPSRLPPLGSLRRISFSRNPRGWAATDSVAADPDGIGLGPHRLPRCQEFREAPVRMPVLLVRTALTNLNEPMGL
jgi:hypothetical protein